MKNLISLGLCIFCILKLYGQDTYPITFHSLLNEKIHDITEKDGVIVGVGRQSIDDYDYSTSLGIIWKIDNQLDTISKSFRFNDTTTSFLSISVCLSGYTVYGNSFYPPNYDVSGFFKLELDNDLNIISKTNIDLSSSLFKWLYFAKTIDDYTYFFGNETDSLGNIVQTITKVDSVSNLIDKFYYNDDWGQFKECLHDPDSNLFYVFTMGMLNRNNSIMVFNDSLELISSKEFPSKYDYLTGDDDVSYENNLDVSWYSDSTFLVGCTHSRSYPRRAPHIEHDFGYSILDTTMSLQPIQYIGTYDTVDHAGFNSNHDYITLASIYYCGTKNDIIDFYPRQPSWIVAGKFDHDLNKIYERYYGGDANYKTAVIKALSNGGCVIGAKRYDHLTQGYEWDATFLKLDSDGYITSSSGNINPPKSIKIYPNPVTDFCYVESNDVGEVMISDLRGRVLKIISVKKGANQIDLSALKPSFYNLIFRSKTIISSHKIIKL